MIIFTKSRCTKKKNCNFSFFLAIYATQLYKNQIQFFVHIGLSFSTPNNPSLRYHPQQLCFSLRTSRPTLSGFITRSQEWWDRDGRNDEGVMRQEERDLRRSKKRKQEVSDIRLRAPVILLAAIFRNPKRKKRI